MPRAELEAVIDDPILRAALLAHIPSKETYYTRAGFQLARLRALMALAALRANKPEVAQSLIDPFTGKPLVITGTMIYSLGPDRIDQGGRQEYSAASDDGGGDVVVERRFEEK